jgi:hypothetical protein
LVKWNAGKITIGVRPGWARPSSWARAAAAGSNADTHTAATPAHHINRRSRVMGSTLIALDDGS